MPRWAANGPSVVAALLVGAAAGMQAGCAAEPESAAPPVEEIRPEIRRQTGLDVLLITVDTLRADALGAYGAERAETPWMDRLAATGVRFDEARAHNVLTLPSHANLLSGRSPLDHGVRDNAGFRFPPEVATLATLLAAQGYRTGAFVSAFPLDSRFGLAAGFEVYEDAFVDAVSRPAFLEQERAGTETVALARRWLEAGDGRPSLCWLHLYEPHFPYAPPAPFDRRFAGDPYAGEVAAADAALGPLLEPILAAAGGSDTLVVLTSDHGESLGEHGEATHGIFAYEGALRVPLILHQPRLLAPRAVAAPARHVDVLPTVLDALALPIPDRLAGRSLLPLAAGGAAGEPVPTYFEALSGQLNRGWAPLYGVVHEGSKYIDLPIPELYDLRRDPREEVNRAAAEPARAAALGELLAGLRAGDRGPRPGPEAAEVRQRLRSLGYLSANGPPPAQTYGEADDPKRLIGLDAVLREVAGLHSAGDLAGALRRSRELVRRRPQMRVALLDLANLERESGDLGAAVRALEAALALLPEDPATLALLAACLTQAGRADEAVELTASHAGLAVPDLDVLLARGLAFARLGRPDRAGATFDAARALDPGNPKVEVYEGTFHLMGGRRAAARAAYLRAVALNPATAAAHSALGAMAAEDGEAATALEHWRRALALDPREHAKLLAIGRGLWQAGRVAEARPLLELFVASAPGGASGAEVARVRALLAGG